MQSNADPAQTKRETRLDSAPWATPKTQLERLPPDLYHVIMAKLDLQQLSALVQTSPPQQYPDKLRQILYDSINATLGSAAIDAYAVYQSTTWRPAGPAWAFRESQKNQDAVVKFVQLYAKNKSGENRYAQLTKGFAASEELDVFTAMSDFYLGIVQPISELFAQSIWEELCAVTGEKDTHVMKRNAWAELSRTERIRLVRATYRFQLLCYAVDHGRLNLSQDTRGAMLRSFLALLQPWEIEELFSFYKFVLHTYGVAFDRVQSDLHPDHPRFDDQGRPPTPKGAFELDGYSRENFLEGIALKGLPLLHTVLFGIRDQDHLVSLMQENIVSSYVPIDEIDGIFCDLDQEVRRTQHTSKKDRRQDRRESFPFRGDSDDGDPAEQPPLAWTVIWGGTYSNTYGWYIPNTIRRWGYIFWDATTLVATGARQVLERQWEEAHDGEDPREYMYC